jgi:lambda repressor-like predicted transcriptional regulator
MQLAVVDQINAELGALGWSITDLAREMGRPYDSTRNYMKKEKAMPLGFLLQAATVVRVPVEEIVSRARTQQLDKYLKPDAAPSSK